MHYGALLHVSSINYYQLRGLEKCQQRHDWHTLGSTETQLCHPPVTVIFWQQSHIYPTLDLGLHSSTTRANIMRNTLLCAIVALLLRIDPTNAQGQATSTSLDTVVLCDAVESYACAFRLVTGPSPICTTETNCTYPVGKYSITFSFTSGISNGTNIQGNVQAWNGFSTGIHWAVGNKTCDAMVNKTLCTSCTVCSDQTETFSADCTNIPNGIKTSCQNILPVFYPLDSAFSYPNASVGGSISSNFSLTNPSHDDLFTKHDLGGTNVPGITQAPTPNFRNMPTPLPAGSAGNPAAKTSGAKMNSLLVGSATLLMGWLLVSTSWTL